MNKPSLKGFSLLELLIVMAIIAILAAIAYPSYQFYIVKIRRVDGQNALIQLASKMEKYALSNGSYQAATLAKVGLDPMSPNHYYQLMIVSTDAQHYLIAAVPRNIQSADKTCGALAMNDLGEKGRLIGNAILPEKECW